MPKAVWWSDRRGDTVGLEGAYRRQGGWDAWAATREELGLAMRGSKRFLGRADFRVSGAWHVPGVPV